jgi:hypothetical protein
VSFSFFSFVSRLRIGLYFLDALPFVSRLRKKNAVVVVVVVVKKHMDDRGFAAVELNDSFDEKGGRRDFQGGDDDEKLDEEMMSSSPRPTASSTRSASFATPPTTTGKSGETRRTRREDDEERQNHLSRSSAESSPSPTGTRTGESRDTISELPHTPTRHLPGGSPVSQYRNHEHNRSISATSMDGLISRLDEESGSGVGETTNVRFDEFTDAFVRRRRESNVVVRAASKALDVPWCFGESRKTRKNVLIAAIVLVLILFAAIPLRHWQHMS